MAQLIKEHTGVKYSRTITSVHNFDLQENLYRFNPSVYHLHMDKMMELARQFVELEPEEPKIFYIWGHSYEMDYDDSYWSQMDEFCKLLSGREDIFYGTNKEVLLG